MMIRKKNIKSVLILTSLLLVILAAVGGTIALLTTKTESVVNEFEPTKVPISVDENFDGETKSDVQIRNDGTTDAYIRAKILVNWVDSEGNIVAGKNTPSPDEVTNGKSEKWFKSGEYYYYSVDIEPDACTENLINSYTYKKTNAADPDLRIDILAQSIQSEPEEVVETVWPDVEVVNGNLRDK